MKELRLILGDQLNKDHSWFDEVGNDITFVMFEMRQETDYVTHHIQKVVAFFAAMRNFRDYLKNKGFRVIYYTLDDDRNEQGLYENLKKLIDEHNVDSWAYQLPDEFRLDQQLKEISQKLGIKCNTYDTEHFYTEREEVADHFKDSSFLMERFYRHMRKKHNVLMEDGKPLGGDWNYDEKNRKKFPRDKDVPKPFLKDHDVTPILEMVKEMKVETIGEIDEENFIWPLDHAECQEALDYFLKNHLKFFGDYQDAMTTRSAFLYHSKLSFAMNSKMLSPKYVVDQAEKYYREHQESIHISQIEGFIRQILGWREYMRGVYWAKMPEYANENFFGHDRELPEFYWTAETNMQCMRSAIGQSLEQAYAHHIQRLMVTGNFALLAGVDPDEVDKWYLGIYIDAIEWVEMPNTRGMSQYADGGFLATKPYISSSNYIHKMSNYCSECKYARTKKTGENACPFNSLYWRFIANNEDKLSSNHRMSMMYSVWNKYTENEQKNILDQANYYLEHINDL